MLFDVRCARAKADDPMEVRSRRGANFSELHTHAPPFAGFSNKRISVVRNRVTELLSQGGSMGSHQTLGNEVVELKTQENSHDVQIGTNSRDLLVTSS